MATDDEKDPIEVGADRARELAAKLEAFILTEMGLEPAELLVSALCYVHANALARAIPDDASLATRFLNARLVPLMEDHVRDRIEARQRQAIGVVEKIGRLP